MDGLQCNDDDVGDDNNDNGVDDGNGNGAGDDVPRAATVSMSSKESSSLLSEYQLFPKP